MKTKQLSQTLRERRELLNLSLEKLSQKTGIPTKYLRRIEEGEWERLPSRVYVRGFLRKYAEKVGINPDEVVKKYEALKIERGEKPPPKAKIPSVTLSPRTARVGAYVIVFLVVVGYIGYQLSAVFILPELAVESPAGDETTVFTEQIILKGRVEPGSTLLLNGQSVPTNPGGEFSIPIDLLPGLNTLEVKAVSRFNRETTITRRIIYNP